MVYRLEHGIRGYHEHYPDDFDFEDPDEEPVANPAISSDFPVAGGVGDLDA